MRVLTRIKKRGIGALSRSKSKKQEKRQSFFLKVVHPHGYIEIFREPITAGEIMRRYPQHCVTRPDFFDYPWIVVRPTSLLVPGKEFFLVSFKTVDRVLKEKRQQMESLNLEQNHVQNVAPQYYRTQTNHQHQHRHRHRSSNEESYGNGREDQDSDNGSQYKSSFYESWNEMQRRILQLDQGSNFDLYAQLNSPLDNRRPRVESFEQDELQRIKSCMSKPNSDRKNLNLRVSFASAVVILGSWSWRRSAQQKNLDFHLWNT